MGLTALPFVLCLIAAAIFGAAGAWLAGRRVASQHAARIAALHASIDILQRAQSAQAAQIAELAPEIAGLHIRLEQARSSSHSARLHELDPDFDETKDWAV